MMMDIKTAITIPKYMVLALALTVSVLMVALPVMVRPAISADIFTVYDVTADKTADNSVIARDQATAEATQKAFDILAKRILSQHQYAQFTMPEEQILNSFVSDFEISNEQLSQTRYVAKFTFRFKPENVRQFFEGGNTDIMSQEIPPVLILPFFQTQGGEITFWEDPNPWKDNWLKHKHNPGIVPVRLPLGDISDVSLAEGIGNVLSSGDLEPLRRLMQKYDVKDSSVILAKQKDEDKVEFFVYEPIAEDMHQLTSWTTDMAMTDTDAWTKNRHKAQDYLYQRWKKQASVQSVIRKTVELRAQFSSMREWVKIKRKIEESDVFDQTDLASLDTNGAVLQARIKTNEQKMISTLANAGLSVSRPVLEVREYGRLDTTPAYVVELSQY